MPKVSVIIPVYKAEKYINRCLDSLFRQSIDNIEYIFIDDKSPDNSIQLITESLHKYPNRIGQVKIIRNDKNLGVGDSRQKGVDNASGEYVIHCDPDDWVDENMYELLYKKAIEEKAEIVLCDYIIEKYNNQEIVSLKVDHCTSRYLVAALVKGRIHGSLCNKLVKRELLTKNNIRFIQGLNICEDLIMCIKILSHDITISYFPHALYHYDQVSNPGSLSSFNSGHGKDQLLKWKEGLKESIGDTNSINYCTGICYNAYWAFTHNTFTTNEYLKLYFPEIIRFIKSERNIIEKMLSLLSAIGLKYPLFWLYKLLKY